MLQISELSGRHDRESFDCGKPELNKYLQQVAAQHVKKSLAKVYVACAEDDLNHVLAFYSLNACEIAGSELPESFRKRFPHRIPAVRLGRLAVAKACQRQGLGERMLFHAMWNISQVDEIIGVVALLVDAKDEEAKRFYLKYGFLELPDRPLSLFLPIDRIRETLARSKR